MVTDYPTSGGHLHPHSDFTGADKYPMAGMTSHKVTVGIYNRRPKKTGLSESRRPTDRYFYQYQLEVLTKESVYVIELNRDQNHALLCCYDAETGEPLKSNSLYEEKQT